MTKLAIPVIWVMDTALLLRLWNTRNRSAIALFVPMQLLISFTLVSAFWQTISCNADGKPFDPLWVIGSLVLLFGAITVFMLGMLFRFYRRWLKRHRSQIWRSLWHYWKGSQR